MWLSGCVGSSSVRGMVVHRGSLSSVCEMWLSVGGHCHPLMGSRCLWVLAHRCLWIVKCYGLSLAVDVACPACCHLVGATTVAVLSCCCHCCRCHCFHHLCYCCCHCRCCHRCHVVVVGVVVMVVRVVKIYDVSHTILHHAPLIPAGMNPFHWNPQESAGMAQESTGMELEWTGMALEWTKMDILELRV